MPLRWLLDVTYNRIHDLTPILSMPVNALLGLSGNRITDLSPLADKSVSDMGIAGNPITTLGPLLANPPKSNFAFADAEYPNSLYEEAIAAWQNQPAYAGYLRQAQIGLACNKVAQQTNKSISRLPSSQQKQDALTSLKSFGKVHEGYRYLEIYGYRTWKEARALAEPLGGELAAVKTPELHLWLCETFPHFNGWIGAYTEDGKHFHWTDGSPLDDIALKHLNTLDTVSRHLNSSFSSPRTPVHFDAKNKSWGNWKTDTDPLFHFLMRWKEEQTASPE